MTYRKKLKELLQGPRRKHQVLLFPFAHPQTIKTRPGIHRPGAAIAAPKTANGIPVKNSGFRNALSIATSP
jgi:hypothetical protein